MIVYRLALPPGRMRIAPVAVRLADASIPVVGDVLGVCFRATERPAACAFAFLRWRLTVRPPDLTAHPFPLGTVWTDLLPDRLAMVITSFLISPRAPGGPT